MIQQLHRELRDLILHVEDIFGLPLLVNVLSQFTTLTLDAHVAYLYMNEIKLTNKDIDLMYLASFGCWVVFSILILSVLSNVSGSLIDEVCIFIKSTQ